MEGVSGVEFVEEGTLRQAGQGPDHVTRLRSFVAALRSGQFEQATKVLARIVTRNEDSNEAEEVHYCCLGVACEIAIADGLDLHKQDGEHGNTVFYGGFGDVSNNILPQQVSEWYGFGSDDNPSLKIPAEICGEVSDSVASYIGSGDSVAAAELNDEYELDFAQIADCFEYTCLPADWEVTRAAR